MRRYSSLILILLLVTTLFGCLHRRSHSVTTRGPERVTGLVPIDSSAATGLAATTDALSIASAASPSSLSDYVRAVLKISQENTVSAERVLTQLHERRPELAALARRAAANAGDIESRRVLAEAYVEADLLPFAFQMYQEILTANAGNAEAEVGIATVWDRWGDYSLARQHAEQAVLLRPDSPRALETLGRIYLHRNELDSALSAFLSAIRAEPKNASLLANAGYVLLKRGDFLQARLYLEEAVALDNASVEAHNNLGIALARLGDSDRALREFMAVGEPAAAFNNLGVVLLGEKKWANARGAFQRALAIDPNYDKAKKNLAEVENRMPRPAMIDLPPAKNAGEVAVERPRTTVPGRPTRNVERIASARESRLQAAYVDARSRFRAKRFAEAIAVFGWLLAQDPAEEIASNCQYLVGESYFRLGDFNRARAAFKRVVQYGNTPRRSDALVMLRRTTAKQQLGKRVAKA